ncbi:MAG: hypothetical protein HDR21_05535 [Lachnospiraceae bacterium]|nr:hypothetical protein [Lachnospiraceae bacterium]
MKYTGELKTQKLSVRVTDEIYSYILSFPGEKLSDKFHALIRLSMQNGSPECMNRYVSEIEQIQDHLNEICEKLKNV